MFLSTAGTAHIASIGLYYGSRMGHSLHTQQMRIHLSREIVTKKRGRRRKRQKTGRKEKDRCVRKDSISAKLPALATEDWQKLNIIIIIIIIRIIIKPNKTNTMGSPLPAPGSPSLPPRLPPCRGRRAAFSARPYLDRYAPAPSEPLPPPIKK